MASTLPSTEEAVFFRPSKKRKVYRQRATDDDQSPEPQIASPQARLPPPSTETNPQSIDELIASSSITNGGSPSSTVDGELINGNLSIADILRLRKKSKRAGGVEFRVESGAHGARDDNGEPIIRNASGEVERSTEEEPTFGTGVIRKFAAQTGTVGDVNKHM